MQFDGADCVQQFRDGGFARTSDGVVNVGRVDRGFRIQRRKVAAPDDGRCGGSLAGDRRDIDCGLHLRATHDGHADGVVTLLGQGLPNRRQVVSIDIAVNDSALTSLFQHAGQCE